MPKHRPHKTERHRRHNENRQTVGAKGDRNERVNDKKGNRVERDDFIKELGLGLLRPPFQDAQPRILFAQRGEVTVLHSRINLA